MTGHLDTALALSELGMFIFPCRPSKAPYPKHGLLEASPDPDSIRSDWNTWPDALVGVVTGPSGLVVADIDVKPDKNGLESLRAAQLTLPRTFNYLSVSGKGRHIIYAAPEGFDHGPTQDHTTPEGVSLRGLDRRSGGSYVVWSGGIPTSRDEFKAPPAWLLTPTGQRTASARRFEGDVIDWLNQNTPDGNVDDPAASLMVSSIMGKDFSRDRMLRLQIRLLGLAKRGSVVRSSLMTLYNEWLRDEWGTTDNERDFLVGLSGAIPKVFEEEFKAPETETEETPAEQESSPDTEDEEDPIAERWSAALAGPVRPIDRDALRLALLTFCKRVRPDFEIPEGDDAPTDPKLLGCLNLLSQVRTAEEATKWLSTTKTIMSRTLGVTP